MEAAVSTACLYPKALEESLYDLAVNGAGSVCIAVNTRSELKKSFAHGAANLLKRFDMKCSAVSGFSAETDQLMLFSDYERRVSDVLEYYKLYFNFMETVGSKVFIFDGPRAGCSIDMFCERYGRLLEIAQEFGIYPALRNVNHWQSGSTRFIREIAGKMGSSFSFVLDTRQAARSKESPFAFIDAAGNSVRSVLISDSSERGDNLPIGRGRFRFKEFLAKMQSTAPDAHIILDLSRSSFNGISELLADYNKLYNMISSLKKEVQT